MYLTFQSPQDLEESKLTKHTLKIIPVKNVNKISFHDKKEEFFNDPLPADGCSDFPNIKSHIPMPKKRYIHFRKNLDFYNL